jgi:hypothetical protein
MLPHDALHLAKHRPTLFPPLTQSPEDRAGVEGERKEKAGKEELARPELEL